MALVVMTDACGRKAASDVAPPAARVAAPVVDEPSDGAATADTARADAGDTDGRALPAVDTDWCLDAWRGLDEGTCYFLPDPAPGESGPPRRLLVYLSGIVPPTARSPQKENVQRVVAAAAQRAHAAALLPRGRRGIGPKDARDWWAWPTAPADHARYAKEMALSFASARARLEAALGRPFERAYLAGSSSGAYFLASLALSGEVDFDGYAAASGGAPGAHGDRGDGGSRARPFYVGYASGDPTNGGPKALGAYLRAAGWPVRTSELPGGHGAREAYLTEAFAFWEDRAAER